MSYTSPAGALNHTRIVEILPRRKVVFVYDDAKLGPTLKLMNERGLTAIPVFKRENAVHRCLGWLDMRSIMLYLAFGKFKNIATADGSSAALFDRNVAWADQTVVDLLQLNPANAYYWEYNSNDEVAQLIDPFVKGVHRVIVASSSDPTSFEEADVCTQSDFVRFIFHSYSAFGRNTDKSVESLGLSVTPSLVTVPSTATALDAFRKAVAHDLHAVGVVDEGGRLVGTISASDLKALDAEHLRFATLNVLDFLRKYSPRSVKPITVSKQCILRTVIAKLLQNRLHRIWVVDGDHKPTGVISMTDVIRVATKEE